MNSALMPDKELFKLWDIKRLDVNPGTSLPRIRRKHIRPNKAPVR